MALFLNLWLRKQIEVRKKHASEGMDMALVSFKKNPSAENFNCAKSCYAKLSVLGAKEGDAMNIFALSRCP